MRLAVDIMGADHAPEHLWQGIIEARRELPANFSLVVLAAEGVLSHLSPIEGVELCPTASFIGGEEEPLTAIRRKGDSSLMLGIKMVAEGHCEGLVSCGSSGALLAGSVAKIPLVVGIRRPAFLTEIPTNCGSVVLIDAGANICCRPDLLVQFALLAAAYSKKRGVSLPKVALLNIGKEPNKGSATLQETYRCLEKISTEPSPPFCFTGNIEARDLFFSDTDVIVCDGFTGNILLKTIEGMGLWLLQETALNSPLRSKLDYLEYPGALLCGLTKTVLKCHGSATPQALMKSILFTANVEKGELNPN